MLHLDRFDKGDILLLLVLVYLFIESEDEDWLIVLALVLLMGFCPVCALKCAHRSGRNRVGLF